MKDSCHEASLKDAKMIFQTTLCHIALLQIDKHPSSLRDTFKRNCFRRPRSKQTLDLMRAEQTREKLLRKLLEDLFTFSHFLPVLANKVGEENKTSIVDSGAMTRMVLYLNFTLDENHSACHKHCYSLPFFMLRKKLSCNRKTSAASLGSRLTIFHPFVLVPSIRINIFRKFSCIFSYKFSFGLTHDCCTRSEALTPSFPYGRFLSG